MTSWQINTSIISRKYSWPKFSLFYIKYKTVAVGSNEWQIAMKYSLHSLSPPLHNGRSIIWKSRQRQAELFVTWQEWTTNNNSHIKCVKWVGKCADGSVWMKIDNFLLRQCTDLLVQQNEVRSCLRYPVCWHQCREDGGRARGSWWDLLNKCRIMRSERKIL